MEARIVSESLPVEKIYHPFVCGPNNAIIKKLTEETGAIIKVPPPRVFKDEILVSGNKDAVNKCKATIMSIYHEKKNKCQAVPVRVRKFQHKFVIGSHGSYLQKILAKTGVSVEVPFLENPSETITLRGEHSKIGLALKMVYSKANDVIMAVVNAPERLYKFIIGKKGENIKRITQGCPKVHVEFLQGKDKIQVKGPHNEVKRAVSAIQNNVNKLLINETGNRRILIGEGSHKSDLRSYHCNVCKKKFLTKSGMKKHKRHHKEVRPWNYVLVRRFCRKTGVVQYERHLEDNQHNVFSVRQKGISRKWKPWLYLYHKDFRRYDCSICDEEHLTKREPWQHLRHQKGRNNFRCSLRDEEYSESKETYIRPYQCNTCDGGYSTQRDLWQHLRVHKDFRCNFRPSETITKRLEAMGYWMPCKKLTLFEIGGFQEILSKTEKRKPCKSCQCKFCRKRFSQNSKPEPDKENHNACDNSTNKQQTTVFIKGSNFRIPEAPTQQRREPHVVYDARRYQCDFCDKKFTRKKAMNDQKQQHVDVGHYQCDVCGKIFPTKIEMEEHRQHHPGKNN
ncbi:hypothetical protein ACJMK2_024305 [Sinanodonta woodiana]|uniref:C2H2-type domain-containing protein n=1 Tax=Sinanodonta woodiana TaxID=1069815 RepID=A0ABD3T8T2_SINWO